MYELNMSKEDIMDTVCIINESKTLAVNEEANRQLNKSEIVEISGSSNVYSSNEKLEKVLPCDPMDANFHDPNIKKTVKDATKVVFGYSDMLDCTVTELTVIDRDPIYKTIFDHEFFINGTESERLELLHRYHKYLSDVQYRIAKRQPVKASMPDLIKLSFSHDSFSDDFEAETYISRSGRQTKRKNYSDPLESEDTVNDTTLKKSKMTEDSEWLSKSKALQSSNTPKTYKFKKANISVQNEARDLIENEAPQSPVMVNKQQNPAPKPLTIADAKKLANLDIIKRSKLFNDSPIRSPRSTSRRCETMFDKLIEGEKTKQKTEREMERFEESLSASSQDVDTDEIKIQEDQDMDVVIVKTDEPAKRRVVPPVPRRRPPIHAKKTSKPSAVPASPKGQKSEDDDVRCSVRERSIQDAPSTSEPPSTNKISCPICAKDFSKTEIEDHAATCGEEPIITRTSTKYQQITCEICDKVFPLNTEYEVHTRECRKQQEVKDRVHQSKKYNN